MDYTKQSLRFRLRKAARYVRLYGLRRTVAKVRGQYHMNRRYDRLPAVPDRPRSGPHVGILGCGNFAFSNVAYYLQKNYGDVIHGVMDVNLHRSASLFQRYRANYYTDDADRILTDPAVDLVYIASNHASHAEYAIQALERGKSVHIEKPHVVRQEQLERLCDAMRRSKGKVGLGFNRPHSEIGRRIKEALDSQSGASMYNWFIAGHEIPADHWYFGDEEGGRVLGNLCHWTDFVFQMMPPTDRFPLVVRPTRSSRSDCDIAVTFTFGDGSIAATTFSAKGHTFEGVRERFAAHRGNVLISMDDFKHLVIEDVERKTAYRGRHRDHGHERTIRSSYEMVRPRDASGNGCEVSYIWETARLFLETKTALEERSEITLEPYPGP